MSIDAHPLDAYDVIVVGAGHAGVQLVASLAKGAYAGSVLVLDQDEGLPYQRPPLSKEFMVGTKSAEEILHRPADYWEHSPASLVLRAKVVAVDAQARTVRTEDGRVIDYGVLVWAAGGDARRLSLPGADLHGVMTLRRLEDAAMLRETISGDLQVVIVGGGYIGLEIAASLADSIRSVTVLEAQSRLLQRVTSPVVSEYFLRLHRSHGVDVRLSAELTGFTGVDRVDAVEMADGERIPADLVIVGVGMVPRVEPLRRAGAEVSNGVAVDELCRTTLEGIYAIGDCAAQVRDFAGGSRLRLESVQNAVEQAKFVAGDILGTAPAAVPAPWFWSDQYDTRLQTVGVLPLDYEAVVRGDPNSAEFSVAYLDDAGRLVAIDCINRAADFMHSRAILSAGPIDAPSGIADPSIPLKPRASALA